MKTDPRTPEEFVEDMVSDGNNLTTILAVARATYWKNRIDEVEKEFALLEIRRNKSKSEKGQ